MPDHVPVRMLALTKLKEPAHGQQLSIGAFMRRQLAVTEPGLPLPDGPVNILIVDDRPENLLALEASLAPLGERLIRAHSGDEALRVLLTEECAVILLDVQMPGMSGVETALRIKAREQTRYVPLIFLTASDAEQFGEGYAAGAVDYLTKPFRPDILLSKVGVFVDLYRKQRQIVQQQELLRLSERRELELKRVIDLRESEERFADVVTSAMDAIIVFDGTGTMLLVNPAAQRMFGATAADLTGQDVGSLIPEAHRESTLAELRRGHASVAATSGPLFTFVAQRSSGDLFPAEATVSCLGINGRLSYTLVLRDVSERVGAAAELAAYQVKLQKSQKMEAIGRVAGGIAHDFNNLLTVILGRCDLALMELPIDSDLRTEFEEIRHAGAFAAELTRQLLAFSRHQVLTPKVFALSAAAGNSEHMLNQMLPDGITLEFDIAPDTPCILADESQIQQIILNLGVNARDAMPDGGALRVQTGCAVLAEPLQTVGEPIAAGRYAVLKVIDTGTGIPAHVRDRIFEPFVTTKERGRGTGLGLATVYGIVQQSGGGITFSSEEGRGTTFTVYLPSAADGAQETHDADAGKPSLAEARCGAWILLVEDEQAVRELTRLMLERGGYHVLAAADASEALRLAQAHGRPVDLLVTDVILPRVGGKELADALLALQPGLRVLFVSGYSSDMVPVTPQRGLAVLEKPFSGPSLVSKVQELLSRA